VAGTCAEDLARLAPALRGLAVLAPVAAGGRTGLLRDLAALGISLSPVDAYALERHPVPLPAAPDAIVLPSSTAAEAVLGHGAVVTAPVVVIGARTAAAAHRLGARRVISAAQDSVAALVAATIALLVEEAPCPR
jgi:uroporphyrinogen-III synthase